MLINAKKTDGTQFVTTHSDGSIAFWSIDNCSQPVKIKKPYGN